eukprot:976598-Prymnesium_polylepis.1
MRHAFCATWTTMCERHKPLNLAGDSMPSPRRAVRIATATLGPIVRTPTGNFFGRQHAKSVSRLRRSIALWQNARASCANGRTQHGSQSNSDTARLH